MAVRDRGGANAARGKLGDHLCCVADAGPGFQRLGQPRLGAGIGAQHDPDAVGAAHAILHRAGIVAVAHAGFVAGQDALADQEAGQFALGNVELDALPGAAAFQHRGHHHAGGEDGNDLVGVVQRHAGDRRHAVGGAADGGKARGRVQRGAIGRRRPVRPGFALAGDGGQDDARIGRQQIGEIQVQPFQHAAAEILQHHVSLADQAQEQRPPVGRFQVDPQATLVAVGEAEETGAVPPIGTRRAAVPGAEQVDRAARFDLHHLGAEIGEQRGGRSPGGDRAEVEHANAG